MEEGTKSMEEVQEKLERKLQMRHTKDELIQKNIIKSFFFSFDNNYPFLFFCSPCFPFLLDFFFFQKTKRRITYDYLFPPLFTLFLDQTHLETKLLEIPKHPLNQSSRRGGLSCPCQHSPKVPKGQNWGFSQSHASKSSFSPNSS